ncbi:MAG: hypothetical protein ACM3QW_05705 [Ignavibacteriales bacterium]
MSIEFEQKYIVLKRSDIETYLNPEWAEKLYKAIDAMNINKIIQGKPTHNTYLVINTDEQYAGAVAQIMQAHGHFTPGGTIEVIIPEDAEPSPQALSKWDKLLDFATKEEDRYYDLSFKAMETHNAINHALNQGQASAFQRVRYAMEAMDEEEAQAKESEG